MSEMNYLSEEELARLIGETEQSGMLKAPSYLKREILEQAAQIDAQKEETGQIAELTVGKKEVKPETGMKKLPEHAVVKMTPEQKKKAYRRYRIKVAGAAAAAIVALFLIPAGMDQPQKTEDMSAKFSMMTEIHKQTNDWCSQIFEASNAFLAPTGSMKR